jgi:transposase
VRIIIFWPVLGQPSGGTSDALVPHFIIRSPGRILHSGAARGRGKAGSRRWKKTRARQRKQEARHRRQVRQAQHEAAAAVIAWAVARRVGTLKIGDPRGVLALPAGRRHNKRVRDWRPGYLLAVLQDKAARAGITAVLVDERGTSSTCPCCARRVPKPAGRQFACPHCGFTGHRDLVGGANIASRTAGGGSIRTGNAEFPVRVTHPGREPSA